MNDSSSRHLLLVVGIAMGLLVLMSAMPWSALTGNLFKDFNLLEDLFPKENIANTEPLSEAMIDPELQELIAQAAENDNISQPNPSEPANSSVAGDTLPEPVKAVKETPIIDGMVAIESYDPAGAVLPKFRQALTQSNQKRIRLAVIGDSFVEGDIFCQDLRDKLQEHYGGQGVGFMAMHSDFPGFRKTVRQNDNGSWEMHDLRSLRASDSLRTLSGDYAVSQPGALSRFDGAPFSDRTRRWLNSALAYLSSDSGAITLKTDAGSRMFDVSPSSTPTVIEMPGETKSFTVSTDIAGLKVLGAYLDGESGIQLDCMSIRGNSGVGHRKLNQTICQSMAEYADYSLIIVEFGINALSAEQSDYTPYMLAMVQTVKRLQQIYPEADILIMGISDRGTKNGADIVSLPTCQAMVNAQRETASRTGVHFWDTRTAMGGDGAIVDWRRRKLMNADYIHLNHAGGGELASLFYQSLIHALDE